MDNVATQSMQQRLEAVFQRALPRLAPEAAAQLGAIINPTALAIIAGVLVAWVVSHAFGIGEVIDIAIAALGLASIGFAVFTGLDHLYDFASGTYRAKTPKDLDLAADHLTKAIAILGVQTVLAILFRGAKAPKVGKGGRVNVGAAPRTAGLRYKPTIVRDPALRDGAGWTSFWGDIVVSSRGSAAEQAVVLLHERVHQFLMPKLYVLRNYRMSTRAASYMRSSLWRYIEEALAETIAQVGVNGFKQLFTGLKFPVGNGYMFLRQGGGFDPAFTGFGAATEAAGLLYNGVVAGVSVQLWFQPANVH